ncbi:MAG: class I SAM-dependent methyltransferase [Planctomycetota bacterium]
MDNPWLHVPLADYEGHMAAPEVAQARLLADMFAAALHSHRPASAAVLGCAGGNGFERIQPEITRRIVGIDLNPEYVREARVRFERRLPGLELYVGDVQRDRFEVAPVELVFAGLLFEYVDASATLPRLPGLLSPGGVLATVLQLPSPTLPEITPSRYPSLAALASIMRLVSPAALKVAAERCGFRETAACTVESAGGKRFSVQEFRLGG